MIEVIWDLVVEQGARGQLELAFGPGGAWSELVARQPGFRGTSLLSDTRDARRFLVVELWDSEEKRAEALAARRDELSRFDAMLDGWTESRTELGVFAVKAQGTLRPIGKARRPR
ncbi:MAG: antibiotic biosynthesis monooxygenase [Deltaproteobacteria bacterium]|nr:antibiotic biosynthesis monooxygenase [Deltaproteobacteria bacterium]